MPQLEEVGHGLVSLTARLFDQLEARFYLAHECPRDLPGPRRLWREALEATGAPYLHMREFAHSVDAFAGWKDDKARRERLMSGVVTAVLQSELTAVGSAMRVGDFDALTEEERVRFQSPNFAASRTCSTGLP